MEDKGIVETNLFSVVVFDHVDDQVTSAGGGQDRLVLDGDRQQSFSGSDVRNRLVAAHEHITQHKFNNESIGIVKSLTKRRYLKKLNSNRKRCKPRSLMMRH